MPSKTRYSALICKIVLLCIPHVLMLAVGIGYLCLGAYLFCLIEGSDGAGNATESTLLNDTESASSTTTTTNVTEKLFDLEQYLSPSSVVDHGSESDPELEQRTLAFRQELQSLLNQHYQQKEATHGQNGWTLLEGFLYAYSTVTTIGYSHLYTATDLGRVFYVFYGLLGIPICTLVLADWGLLLEEGLTWLCRRILFLCNVPGYGADHGAYHSRLPVPTHSLLALPLAVLFFLVYVMLGGFLLPLWERWTFVEGFYVAFDGVTTIGIGDIYPRNNDYFLATLLYFSVGIAIACGAIGTLDAYLRLLHYAFVQPSDCCNEVVWFGGKHMPVARLVRLVGQELGATEYEVRSLQSRLDRVVRRAFADKPGRGKARKRSQTRDRWNDTVVAPLTLVSVANAASPSPNKHVGDFYGSDGVSIDSLKRLQQDS